MLQLQGISLAWEHFLIHSVWERMWDEHWEQAKGNKGKEMGSREAAGLWEERRDPTPSSGKLGLIKHQRCRVGGVMPVLVL